MNHFIYKPEGGKPIGVCQVLGVVESDTERVIRVGHALFDAAGGDSHQWNLRENPSDGGDPSCGFDGCSLQSPLSRAFYLGEVGTRSFILEAATFVFDTRVEGDAVGERTPLGTAMQAIKRLRAERDRLRDEVVDLREDNPHQYAEDLSPEDFGQRMRWRCICCGKTSHGPVHAYFDPCPGPSMVRTMPGAPE